MSKSKGNVVDPDDMIAEVRRRRAAAVRDVRRAAGEGSRVDATPGSRAASASSRASGGSSISWAETIGGEGIPGPGDVTLNDAERALRRKTHDTIRRVTLDIDERVHLNTAVSALMELVNELYAFSGKSECVPLARPRMTRRRSARRSTAGTVAVLKEAVEALVLMLSPFAPHMAEELWELLGHRGRRRPPPAGRSSGGGREGRRRSSCRCRSTARSARADRAGRHRRGATCASAALQDPQVGSYLEGKTVRKVVDRRRRSSPGQHRGVADDAIAAMFLLGWSRGAGVCRRAATRWRAAARSCRPHQDHRRAALHQHARRLRDRAADHREGQRRVHRPRQLDGRARRARASTRCSPARSSRANLAPAAFNEQQQASRYVLTLVARVELRDVKANKVLWANPACSSARSTTSRPRPARGDAERLLRPGRQRARPPRHRVRARGRQRDLEAF